MSQKGLDAYVWYVIHPGGIRYKEAIGHIDNIDVDIKMDEKQASKMVVIPKYVRTITKVNIRIK